MGGFARHWLSARDRSHEHTQVCGPRRVGRVDSRAVDICAALTQEWRHLPAVGAVSVAEEDGAAAIAVRLDQVTGVWVTGHSLAELRCNRNNRKAGDGHGDAFSGRRARRASSASLTLDRHNGAVGVGAVGDAIRLFKPAPSNGTARGWNGVIVWLADRDGVTRERRHVAHHVISALGTAAALAASRAAAMVDDRRILTSPIAR